MRRFHVVVGVVVLAQAFEGRPIRHVSKIAAIVESSQVRECLARDDPFHILPRLAAVVAKRARQAIDELNFFRLSPGRRGVCANIIDDGFQRVELAGVNEAVG